MGNICSPCQNKNRSKALPLDDDDTDDDVAHDDFKTVLSRRSSWGDDVWHDALMEHDYLLGGEEIFDVTDEELETIQNHLAAKLFPSEAEYMSEAYIRSVASKPYSKNMSIRRPLEVCTNNYLEILC
jgi:hypothetical protein